MADQPKSQKKRRKGLRSRFDRRKNDERKSQRKLESPTPLLTRQPFSTLTNTHAQISSSSPLQMLKSNIHLPEDWHCFLDTESLEYVKMQKRDQMSRNITRSVTILNDLTWKVTCQEHTVPPLCKALSKYPPTLTPSTCTKFVARY